MTEILNCPTPSAQGTGNAFRRRRDGHPRLVCLKAVYRCATKADAELHGKPGIARAGRRVSRVTAADELP